MSILRKILIELDLYNSAKIEKLIEQSSEVIEKYRFSNKIANTVQKATKTVFVPIIAFAAGIITNGTKFKLNDVVTCTVAILIITLLILMFVYEVKLLLESILDGKSEKVNNLKEMLIDINIRDFIK